MGLKFRSFEVLRFRGRVVPGLAGGVSQLFGEAVAAGGGLEGEGGKDAGHGVVGMTGEPAFGAEGEDEVRPELAYAEYNVRDRANEGSASEAGIGIIEHFAGGAEHAAGVGEFAATHGGEFFVGLSRAAIAGGGARGEAEDVDLGATGRVECQGPAEAAGFVVGMRSDHQETEWRGGCRVHHKDVPVRRSEAQVTTIAELRNCRTAELKRRVIIAIAVSCAMLPLSAQKNKAPVTSVERAIEYQSPFPLGIETFVLQPSRRLFKVYASAESPAFNGLKLTRGSGRPELMDGDGRQVPLFPKQIKFRVTATERVRATPSVASGDPPYPLKNQLPMDALLKSLSFRVKIFRGLHARTVEPTAVRMIGVPPDVPYNERIYEAQFNVGEVPVDEKIVLEVLTPKGERLCKFHLEFNWN